MKSGQFVRVKFSLCQGGSDERVSVWFTCHFYVKSGFFPLIGFSLFQSSLDWYLIVLLELQGLADPFESPLVRQLGPLSPQGLLQLFLTHLKHRDRLVRVQ